MGILREVETIIHTEAELLGTRALRDVVFPVNPMQYFLGREIVRATEVVGIEIERVTEVVRTNPSALHLLRREIRSQPTIKPEFQHSLARIRAGKAGLPQHSL